jgi:hypothetical protein
LIIGDVATGIVNSLHGEGQSEPTATNAPVGCSIHWMGYGFSFTVRWDFITVYFFSLLTTVLFSFFWVCS